MPTLNFQRQFVRQVESGEKTHSIRGKRKRAWKVGDKLRLQHGPRFRPALIGRTKVTGLQEVEISWQVVPGGSRWSTADCIHISIDGVRLSRDEAELFACRDGFPDLSCMADFWLDVHGIDKLTGPWLGDLIHWAFPFAAVAAVAA